MSEARTIAAMLHAVGYGPAWHGPAVLEVLDGVTAAQAYQRPRADGHTIWEILLHMNAWQEYGLRVLEGGDASTLAGEADWPPAPDTPGEDAWELAVRQFEKTLGELRDQLMHVAEKRLHDPVPGREFPLKVVMHGVVHHNLYHCGQLALLKKG